MVFPPVFISHVMLPLFMSAVLFFSISAFNHPAGALLLEHHEEMIGKLKYLLDEAGVFQTLLYTNDSEYDTAELFLRYKEGATLKDLGVLYVL